MGASSACGGGPMLESRRSGVHPLRRKCRKTFTRVPAHQLNRPCIRISRGSSRRVFQTAISNISCSRRQMMRAAVLTYSICRRFAVNLIRSPIKNIMTHAAISSNSRRNRGKGMRPSINRLFRMLEIVSRRRQGRFWGKWGLSRKRSRWIGTVP